MVRRLSVLGLAAILLAAAAGCRHSCGSRPGLFTSRAGCEPPCQLVGRSGEMPVDPATGFPIVNDPGAVPGAPIPGGPAPAIRPDELPFPQPSGTVPPPGGLIPPAGVPFAPPAPAPGDGSNVGSVPGARAAQPVKAEPK